MRENRLVLSHILARQGWSGSPPAMTLFRSRQVVAWRYKFVIDPIPGRRAATRNAPGDERKPTGSFSYSGAVGLAGVSPAMTLSQILPNRGVERLINHESNPWSESSHARSA